MVYWGSDDEVVTTGRGQKLRQVRSPLARLMSTLVCGTTALLLALIATLIGCEGAPSSQKDGALARVAAEYRVIYRGDSFTPTP